ncbi:hypothetical protein ACFX2U_07205 [Gilliamella apicola]|uniref:hypothetical protein n=1 Tax=Gilliamella apicola TaxID=1196095 RepID=UPI000A34B61F|nr:hypothetical protein B6D03_03260 [Gilliamella apicola]
MTSSYRSNDLFVLFLKSAPFRLIRFLLALFCPKPDKIGLYIIGCVIWAAADLTAFFVVNSLSTFVAFAL